MLEMQFPFAQLGTYHFCFYLVSPGIGLQCGMEPELKRNRFDARLFAESNRGVVLSVCAARTQP